MGGFFGDLAKPVLDKMPLFGKMLPRPQSSSERTQEKHKLLLEEQKQQQLLSEQQQRVQENERQYWLPENIRRRAGVANQEAEAGKARQTASQYLGG